MHRIDHHQTDHPKQLHILLGSKPNRPLQLATRRVPSSHRHLRLASHHRPRHRQDHHRRSRNRQRLRRRHLAYRLLRRFPLCMGRQGTIRCADPADYLILGLVRGSIVDRRVVCPERPGSDLP
jgi:hypothetical protein